MPAPLKICPHCAEKTPADARFCQKCGHAYRTQFIQEPPTQMYTPPAAGYGVPPQGFVQSPYPRSAAKRGPMYGFFVVVGALFVFGIVSCGVVVSVANNRLAALHARYSQKPGPEATALAAQMTAERDIPADVFFAHYRKQDRDYAVQYQGLPFREAWWDLNDGQVVVFYSPYLNRIATANAAGFDEGKPLQNP